jgi:hypothetical protein
MMKYIIAFFLFFLMCSRLFSQDDKRLTFYVKKQTEALEVFIADMDSFSSSARFMGGEKELKTFIDKAFKKPIGIDISGILMVEFRITELGKVSEVKMLKKLHPLIDMEMIRVVKTMPDWVPAIHEGRAISTKVSLPMNYYSH